jgi:predicted DNA-binding protein (MmcQ/YjbR family)
MTFDYVRDYALSLPYVTEDTPFGPDTLVMRVGGKIFLFLPLDEEPPIKFSIKNTLEKIAELLDRYEDIVPAFHLNKQHWAAVVCGGTLPKPLYAELITESYQIIKASLPKKVKAELSII